MWKPFQSEEDALDCKQRLIESLARTLEVFPTFTFSVLPTPRRNGWVIMAHDQDRFVTIFNESHVAIFEDTVALIQASMRMKK
jgi:hypothetical protein